MNAFLIVLLVVGLAFYLVWTLSKSTDKKRDRRRYSDPADFPLVDGCSHSPHYNDVSTPEGGAHHGELGSYMVHDTSHDHGGFDGGDSSCDSGDFGGFDDD